MIYITTKRPKDTEQRIKNFIIELKEREAVENDLRANLSDANRSLKYWKGKAAELESDLFDSSIINDLYDKGIKNRDGYYQITSYHPIGISGKSIAAAMSSMLGNGFNTSLIYTFYQLVKKIKSTDTDLTAYMIVEVSMK